MSAPISHVPFGPEGTLSYTAFNDGSLGVIEVIKPTVLRSLERTPVNGEESFVICEYGAADGGISLGLIMECVEWIKERYGNKQQVQVVYEDQPINDFKSIFKQLHGLLGGPPSYLQVYDGVFAAACGTSFYSQCLPSNSMHLGFSTTAFHWLSKSPCDLDGTVLHLLCTNETQKRMFTEQAAKDWETILLQRANELKTGGGLAFSVLSIDKTGYFSDTVPESKKSAPEYMSDCWTVMYNEGRITKEEWQRAQLCSYYRSEDELRAAFKPNTEVYKAGLRLMSLDIVTTSCPYHLDWMAQENKDPKAARKQANLIVSYCRTWANYSFLSALSDSRSADEKAALVDELYTKYEDIAALNPDEHGSYLVQAYMYIVKE